MMDLLRQVKSHSRYSLASVFRKAQENGNGVATCGNSNHEHLRRSSCFDEAYYSIASGKKGNRSELLTHYLEEGENRGLKPSRFFEPRFYADTNQDVVMNRLGSLDHYERYGKREGRYPTLLALREDAKLLEDGHLLDELQLSRYTGVISPSLPKLSKYELYLIARDKPHIETRRLSTQFYEAIYDDVASSEMQPVIHFLKIGRLEARVGTLDQLQDRLAYLAPCFDAQHYLAQVADAHSITDPLLHYVLVGERLGLEPAQDFSPEYYSRRYPDIARSSMSPYYHFIRHGIAENRPGRPNLVDLILEGDKQYDPALPTIMVACHEASKTGAPILGLSVISRLCENNNVVAGIGPGGALHAEFAQHSVAIVIGRASALELEFALRDLSRRFALSSIVLNSVETSDYATAALNAGIPSVGLIHEFAEYTLPHGRMTAMVERVDEAIVPARIILDSVQREIIEHRDGPANHISVRPQGFLPYQRRPGGFNDLTRDEFLWRIGVDPEGRALPIVLGSGYVQIRKGVDLFIQAAAECKKLLGNRLRFVWVGSGYHPNEDMAYSVWLADMIERLQVSDIVHFIDHQSSLDTIYGLADVFFLSSRLDPFPNVALDSIKIGKPVICFEKATGIAEFVGPAKLLGQAVPFCDVHAAAAAIADHLATIADAAQRENGAVALRNTSEFDFDEYVRFIESKIELAKHKRVLVENLAASILANDDFDANFHDGSSETIDVNGKHRSALVYAARAVKQLKNFSPKPGVNEGLLRKIAAAHAANGSEKLQTVQGPAVYGPTHLMFRINELKPVQRTKLRIALHLHLHYTDLASEFLERLTSAEQPIDLFITTNSQRKLVELRYEFRNYVFGKTTFIEVPNIGRDIGPFIAGMPTEFRHYDILGHMHGKKSLGVEQSGQMGDTWRTFILDTLLPRKPQLGQIFDIFETNNDLGLLFAEDRHCCGWGGNKEIAAQLASRIDSSISLPDYPVFPLGNMFWIRSRVFEPLWKLNFKFSDLPSEPLPNDGTIAHAIERLLPAVCESSGLTWATVYREGISW